MGVVEGSTSRFYSHISSLHPSAISGDIQLDSGILLEFGAVGIVFVRVYHKGKDSLKEFLFSINAIF